MREKLIEMIRKADKEDHESLTQDVHYAFMADYLIANGVTIKQWIPVTERLPEMDDWVLTWNSCDMGMHIWDNKKRKFVELDSIGSAFVEVRFVTHWMPLPEPPSGERRTDA